MDLCKRRKFLDHSGGEISTPLVVPSFSSRGFKFFKEGGKDVSESSVAFNFLGFQTRTIRQSYLISAYDLYYEHIIGKRLALPESRVIFLDSGGYETKKNFSGTTQGPLYKPKEFSLEKYREVLDALPSQVPLVVTSFDADSAERTVDEQVESATSLFGRYPGFISNFLLKPPGTQKEIDEEIFTTQFCKKLRAFNILGLTEKELGSTLIEQLLRIARIRSRLNEADVDIPIHIYGGLSPALTPLYFFAGADIFDGLSWMRYGFREGVACYQLSYDFLKDGLNEKRDPVWPMFFKNLEYLMEMNAEMREFVENGKDFSTFAWHCQRYEEAYKVLERKLKIK